MERACLDFPKKNFDLKPSLIPKTEKKDLVILTLIAK
jgi:hypothetical protein